MVQPKQKPNRREAKWPSTTDKSDIARAIGWRGFPTFCCNHTQLPVLLVSLTTRRSTASSKTGTMSCRKSPPRRPRLAPKNIVWSSTSCRAAPFSNIGHRIHQAKFNMVVVASKEHHNDPIKKRSTISDDRLSKDLDAMQAFF